MVKVDWLDRLTFREIEMINEVGQPARQASNELSDFANGATLLYWGERNLGKVPHIFYSFPCGHVEEQLNPLGQWFSNGVLENLEDPQWEISVWK